MKTLISSIYAIGFVVGGGGVGFFGDLISLFASFALILSVHMQFCIEWERNNQ